jgi:hypothetical protein
MVLSKVALIDRKNLFNNCQKNCLQAQVDCWLLQDTEQLLSNVDSFELNLQVQELKTFSKSDTSIGSDTSGSTSLSNYSPSHVTYDLSMQMTFVICLKLTSLKMNIII